MLRFSFAERVFGSSSKTRVATGATVSHLLCTVLAIATRSGATGFTECSDDELGTRRSCTGVRGVYGCRATESPKDFVIQLQGLSLARVFVLRSNFLYDFLNLEETEPLLFLKSTICAAEIEGKSSVGAGEDRGKGTSGRGPGTAARPTASLAAS